MDDAYALKTVGVETSFLFAIDSAMRDKIAYPTPSDYYIPFPQSFRNVCAIDLVDASVPRTEYSVESYSNSVTYAPGLDPTLVPGKTVTSAVGDGAAPLSVITVTTAVPHGLSPGCGVVVVSGGTTTTYAVATTPLPSVFTYISSGVVSGSVVGMTYNARMPWANYEAARVAGAAVRVTVEPGDYNLPQLVQALGDALAEAALVRGHEPVRIEAAGDPLELTNKVRFARSQPFALFIGETGLRRTLGFANPAHAPGATVGWDSQLRYSTDSSVANDVFYSVPTVSKDFELTYAGPVPVELAQYTVSGNAEVTQTFTATTSGMLRRVVVRGPPTSNVSTLTATLRLGNAVVESATVTTSTEVSTWAGDFAGTHVVLEGEVYAMTISGTTPSVYRAETFTDDPASMIRVDGVPVTPGGGDALCLDISTTVAGYTVAAPNQACLTGERYVLVRSPNIEQYMNRDLAAAFDRMSPGLGMLKLNGLGYRDERFNFLAYTTRKFHPIGKLKGMTVRLETREGRTYDAHGIDHTLLVCVKMYAPGPATVVPRDLFPGYTPDPRVALIRKLEKERQ